MIKKTLSIIGIGVIAGVVVYGLLSKVNKEEKEDADATEKETTGKDREDIVTEFSSGDNIFAEDDELNNVKSASVNVMSSRHEEASKAMKDALETISKTSEAFEDEKSENENDESELILDELDKWISED